MGGAFFRFTIILFIVSGSPPCNSYPNFSRVLAQLNSTQIASETFK